MSANDDERLIADLMRKGGEYEADGFIKKPISFDDLVTALSEKML